MPPQLSRAIATLYDRAITQTSTDSTGDALRSARRAVERLLS